MLARALAIALLASAVAEAAPRRKGKVVRVERSSIGRGRVPVLCTGMQETGVVTCYGRPPATGVEGAVVDYNGVRANVRTVAIKPVADSCGNTSSWEVTSEIVRGDLTAIGWNAAVVFDYPADERARFRDATAPGPRQETVLAAIDEDGDDRPELMATWYACDAAGRYAAGAAGHYCMVHYRRDGAGFVELRIDVVKIC